MKTITIQLIKNLIYPEKDIGKLRKNYGTLEEYAPPEVYDYKKLGGTDILMLLHSEVLTKDLVPMLEDFYKVFPDPKCIRQREAILQEFGKCEEITWGLCEETGYKHSEAFYPAFVNDVYPEPFLMYEEGVKADCTGIILDVDTLRLVGRHHRQRLVVHVRSNTPLCHLLDDAIALLTRLAHEASNVQVTATSPTTVIVIVIVIVVVA